MKREVKEELRMKNEETKLVVQNAKCLIWREPSRLTHDASRCPVFFILHSSFFI
jgi:hypothetical protein